MQKLFHYASGNHDEDTKGYPHACDFFENSAISKRQPQKALHSRDKPGCHKETGYRHASDANGGGQNECIPSKLAADVPPTAAATINTQAAAIAQKANRTDLLNVVR